MEQNEALLMALASGDKSGGGGGGSYVLPVATATKLGGVKVGSGLSIESDGTLSASGGGGGSVDWADVENKPTDLVQDADYVHTDENFTSTEKQKLAGLENYDDSVLAASVAANTAAIATKQDELIAGDGITIESNRISASAEAFVAVYGVTTAQEIIEHLEGGSPIPMFVERSGSYYTVVTAAKISNERAIIRTFATISGSYYIFTYDITGETWANSNFGFQQLLTSGTNIKTVNGESLLGSGNIEIGGGGGGSVDWADVENKPTDLVQDADYVHTDENFTSTEKQKLAGLENYNDAALVARVADAESAIAAIEEKLADFEEFRLRMTDGTDTVDKIVLAKPYSSPTPIKPVYTSMFQLPSGFYDVNGNKIAELTDGDAFVRTEDTDGSYYLTESEPNTIPNETVGIVCPSDMSFKALELSFFNTEGQHRKFNWIVINYNLYVDRNENFFGEEILEYGDDTVFGTMYIEGNPRYAPWRQQATVNREGVPFPFSATMFALAQGIYDANGNRLDDGAFDDYGEHGDRYCTHTDWDDGYNNFYGIDNIFAGNIIEDYPTARGLVLREDLYHYDAEGELFSIFDGVTEGMFDWIVLVGGVDENVLLSDTNFVETIYARTDYGKPWGQTNATINLTGLPLAWEV